MSNKVVRVRDFTTIPGPRFIASGSGSAEEFFNSYVKPLLKNKNKVTIDFSGTWGYPPSFTSQLGVYLKKNLGGYKEVKARIEIISDDNYEAVDRFWEQLKEKTS
jgi:hypothetical protein